MLFFNFFYLCVDKVELFVLFFLNIFFSPRYGYAFCDVGASRLVKLTQTVIKRLTLYVCVSFESVPC